MEIYNRYFILAAVTILSLTSFATTYYDANGRKQWSVNTDRNGKTTYRDAQGRVQGYMK